MAQAHEVLGDAHVIIADAEGNLYEFSEAALTQARVSEERKAQLHEIAESGEVSGFHFQPTNTTAGTGQAFGVWALHPAPSPWHAPAPAAHH